MSINNTNPSTLFGGTWEQIAQGRTLVGVDINDNDFNTVKKTGGSKFLQDHTHELTLVHPGGKDTVPYGLSYEYDGINPIAGLYNGYSYVGGPSNGNKKIQVGNSGNLQPYFTCYIWLRTA